MKEDGIYEPEQFPGMIIKQKGPKATYLVFSSGKIVIAGCKSLEELNQTVFNITDRNYANE